MGVVSDPSSFECDAELSRGVFSEGPAGVGASCLCCAMASVDGLDGVLVSFSATQFVSPRPVSVKIVLGKSYPHVQ